ncbi:hypothetical protein [Virgibacillus pantothenticus]|nr:hypothetical protein [Virgibacillus pantothenticus]
MIPLSQLIRSIRYVAKRALAPLFFGIVVITNQWSWKKGGL